MTSAQIGLIAGMGMGLAAIVGGFPGFLLVAALGAIVLIVVFDGLFAVLTSVLGI